MNMPLIIEKSATRKGEYVAYIHAHGSTLAELAAMLEKRGDQVTAKLKEVQL